MNEESTTKSIGELLGVHKSDLFQELAIEIEKFFGQKSYGMMVRCFKNYGYDITKEALKICKKRKKKNIGYFIGVLKRMNGDP